MRLLLFLSCCLLAGHEAIAQKDTSGDWYDGRDVWKSLEDFKNETAEVLEAGGRRVSGQLADVTETFVLVERNGTHDKVDRYRVHRITSVHASTRARNTLLGIAYGIGSFGGFSIVYTWGQVISSGHSLECLVSSLVPQVGALSAWRLACQSLAASFMNRLPSRRRT